MFGLYPFRGPHADQKLMVFRRYLFAVVVIASLSACGTSSTTKQKPRLLELILELYDENGKPLKNQPILFSDRTNRYRIVNEQPAQTNHLGVYQASLSYLPHRGVTFLWDALKPPPDRPTEFPVSLSLPNVKSDVAYNFTLFFTEPDELPSNDNWDRSGILNPAFAPPPKLQERKALLKTNRHHFAKNGAVYESRTGLLSLVEMLADGNDTRIVPAVWSDQAIAETKSNNSTTAAPGPRLQVTAEISSVYRHTDKLHIRANIIYYDHE